MKIIQEIIGKGEDFTTNFFMGSFSATAKENRAKFSIVAVVLGKEFHENVNESGRGSESVIRAHSTDLWFSY